MQAAAPAAVIRETDPVRLTSPQPAYPEALRLAEVEGDVTAWVYVDASGKVTSVEIKDSPHELFSSATIATLSRWTFLPATKDGKPVPFTGEYVIQFRLTDPPVYTETL